MPDFNQRLLQYDRQAFFGKYHLSGGSPDKAFLGKGAFSRVYKIEYDEPQSNGHKIHNISAVKIISINEDRVFTGAQSYTKEEKIARLHRELEIVEREIRIMKRLEGDSNIAYFQESAIIDCSEKGMPAWDVLIRMEWLMPLRQYLQEKQFDTKAEEKLSTVLLLWKDLCSALRLCEINGILHTDVKPDNVFYNPDKRYFKLGDFGTSLEMAQFKPSVYRGTPEYMSPEMYHKVGGDSRTDMYSLAVMIYELLNNRRLPLQVGDQRQQAKKERLDDLKEVPPLPGVPKAVNNVLCRCLAIDPAQRYADFEQLRMAIDGLKPNETNEGAPAVERKRNRTPLMAALGACVVGGILLFSVLSSTKRPVAPQQPTPAATSASLLSNGSPAHQAASLRMSLALDQAVVTSGVEEILISGQVNVEGTAIDPSALQVSIANYTADSVQWQEGLRFTARKSAEGMNWSRLTQIKVEVRVANGSPQEVASVVLPVQDVTAPTVPAYAPLILVSDDTPNGWARIAPLVEITGTPQASVAVSLNGQAQEELLSTDSSGRLAFQLPADALFLGRNTATFAYEGQPDSLQTFTFDFDDIPPRVVPDTSYLTPVDDALTLRLLAPDTLCTATLTYGAESLQASFVGDTAQFTGLSSMGVVQEEQLSLTVTDAAGNSTSVPLGHSRQALPAISLEMLVNGKEGTLSLSLQAAPHAQLVCLAGERETLLTTDAEGAASIQLLIGQGGIPQGESPISVAYRCVDGYTLSPAQERREEHTLFIDTLQPDVRVQPQALSSDVRELTITAEGEENGFTAQLLAGEEELVRGEAYRGETSLTLAIANPERLPTLSQLHLRVIDTVGNTTDLPLVVRPDPQLILPDSQSFSGYKAATGEDMTIYDCYLLCSVEEAQRVSVHAIRRDDETAIPLPTVCTQQGEEEYARLLAELQGKAPANTRYASTAWQIQSVHLPDTLTPGQYELRVVLAGGESGQSRSLGSLGKLRLSEAEQAVSRVGAPAFSSDRGLVVGLDVPLQKTFRPDDIVLTGWLSCDAATKGAFGQGDPPMPAVWINDTPAPAPTIHFFRRKNTQSLAQLATDSLSLEAGFVCTLQLPPQEVLPSDTPVDIALVWNASTVPGSLPPRLDATVYLSSDAPAADATDRIYTWW